MKQMKATLCALAVLATTAATAQAQSFDVKVIGTINPAACTPTLSGGGVVDYGNIATNKLKPNEFYALQSQDLALEIKCTAATRVALAATSKRLNSVAGATTESAQGAAAVATNGTYSTEVVGLGLSGSEKIGGYSLALGNVRVGGAGATMIYSDDNRANWVNAGTKSSMYNSTITIPRQLTAATTGTTTPVAFTQFNGTLSVQAYLNKTTDLTLDNAVKLDGQSSIELVYF